uniref:Solute carrier family 16 member 4 n=1 Tax=Rousettus aegyptiacus TaxID=9407 RepID=A0A7J8BH36_ROUAE|nr:solute carrier family 16 member 4 [Rousettus aegyptiacus]
MPKREGKARPYTKALDGGWGWMIVFHFFLVNVFVVGMVKNSAIFFAVFQEEFESTSQQTGWIGSIMASLSIAAGPLVAIIADTYDDKTVSILGAFLITGGFLISSQATSIPFLCVTMGVLPGLGSAFLYQVAVVLISKYFKKRLALSTAISRAGMGLTFLLAPFTKFLIDQYDWTGITESVSQIISGWIADRNWIKKYHYLQFYLIVCSITDLFGPLATTFPLLMTYTIFSAMFSGGYLALIVPVLVDLSAESVTHRFYGFAFFFTGIGTLPGPPIAGWLHDSSQTYAGSFYFSSTCYLLSSVSLFFIPLAERRKKQRLTRRKEDSNQV